MQYMMLCPDLQNKNLATLESLNWVTGVSSPQISGFKVQKSATEDNTYNIQYQIAMGNKIIGTVTDKISVQKANPQSSQRWCIRQFNYLSPSTITPKS
jgi:hypothetical protein